MRRPTLFWFDWGCQTAGNPSNSHSSEKSLHLGRAGSKEFAEDQPGGPRGRVDRRCDSHSSSFRLLATEPPCGTLADTLRNNLKRKRGRSEGRSPVFLRQNTALTSRSPHDAGRRRGAEQPAWLRPCPMGAAGCMEGRARARGRLEGLEAIRRSRAIHGFYARSALEQRRQARATCRLLAHLLDQLRA